MALILNIHTATEVASVSVSHDGKLLCLHENVVQKEHASFVHSTVELILKEQQFNVNDFHAFAVTSGPGSYTGLRVGLAAAKGFCYALSKPLITVNTLRVMAKAALSTLQSRDNVQFICPIIDARRMEVFTAVYDSLLNEVFSPRALDLTDTGFLQFIQHKNVLYTGSGSTKLNETLQLPNSNFVNVRSYGEALGELAEELFKQQQFADLTYAQPEYFKEFYTTKPIVIM